MKMNGSYGVVLLVICGLVTHCQSLLETLDCNYVHNVSVDLSQYGYPAGMILINPYATPIGVCEPQSDTESIIYECKANSVILIRYLDSSDCSGSKYFISFSGDYISYSSFKCDAAFNCPYVQQAETINRNTSCALDMNYTVFGTALTGECLKAHGADFFFQLACTDQTVTQESYLDAECSTGSFVDSNTIRMGCEDFDGHFYPKITCYSGASNSITTTTTIPNCNWVQTNANMGDLHNYRLGQFTTEQCVVEAYSYECDIANIRFENGLDPLSQIENEIGSCWCQYGQDTSEDNGAFYSCFFGHSGGHDFTTTTISATTMEPIILDCNYVQNVSIDGSELWGVHGMIPLIPYGKPIGVCESDPSEMSSKIYECEANGNSVSLKIFSYNTNCEGSNFISFSGDAINYSSFNCDAPSNCPYVQYTEHLQCNGNMNDARVYTILTDVCYYGEKYTCTNQSVSHHDYSNKQCSDSAFIDTFVEGCNSEYGMFYSDIKCSDGVLDFTTTSGTTDTTGVISSTQLQIDTTDTTDTTMEPIILDCNYVQNVSIDVSEFGGPGIVQMITFGSPGTPIGVCTSDSSEMSSKIYECEANGNSVSLKWFIDNINCEGSNFMSFSGDTISYSSFNCDAPSNCPYVQFTKYSIQDMSNPCNVNMNYTFDVTILTDVCYESYYVTFSGDTISYSKTFIKITCANESISYHLYANQQCSDYDGFETHEEGCNDYENGWFYSEIKCYDGVSDFITTSGTTDTTLSSTISTKKTNVTSGTGVYKSILSLITIIIVLNIAN